MAESSGGAVPPWLNSVMKWLLRSPLHGLVSKNIMLITFTGRKSGKQYATPVSYVRENETVTMFTHGKWWKNLRGGAPVTVRIKGKDLQGVADPIAEDKEAIATGLATFLRRVPRDAKYYGVKLDAKGQPDSDDIARDAENTVMIRIRLVEAAIPQGAEPAAIKHDMENA